MPAEAFVFFIALIQYSFAIMAHRATGRLRPWMVWLLGAGLVTDAVATIFACVLTTRGWKWTAHSIFGVAAWLIMALHFCWAVAALRGWGKWAERFDRWSLVAWLVWVYAFVSGIPTTNAKQLWAAAIIILVFGIPTLVYAYYRQLFNWLAADWP